MFFSGIAERLPRLWYRRQLSFALVPFLPISWFFKLIVWLRRGGYRFNLFRSYCLAAPVVVVGNVTVGGSGKTPLVIWLAESLRQRGWRPGIISRGYGGTSAEAQEVTLDSVSSVVGDEPLLLVRRSRVPVFVGRDRVAAGRALLAKHPECNIVISDDGLQHYRLQRSAELVMFDGRGTGNSRLLPAGPLRESLHRLSVVTAVVWNSCSVKQGAIEAATISVPQFEMTLTGERFVSLSDESKCCTARDLIGKRLFAIAGIGDPSRFFSQLAALGLDFEARPFPDHHRYTAADLVFADDGVLLMTEKDAVKCAAIVAREAWVLPVAAQVQATSAGHTLLDTILEKLDGCTFA